jgi:hypothetical protein
MDHLYLKIPSVFLSHVSQPGHIHLWHTPRLAKVPNFHSRMDDDNHEFWNFAQIHYMTKFQQEKYF